MAKLQTLYLYTIERRLIFILCAGLISVVFLYVFFVGATTINVAAHDAIQNDIQTLGSSIGDLESSYIVLSRGISKEQALTLGFKQPQKEIFAFRKRLVRNGF
ncbi:MAG: hypothetical protein Q8R36_05430 [bacterium]|nr:hypothetical protein [bacterium]